MRKISETGGRGIDHANWLISSGRVHYRRIAALMITVIFIAFPITGRFLRIGTSFLRILEQFPPAINQKRTAGKLANFFN